MKALTAVLLGLLGTALTWAQVNQAAIDAVKAGRLKEARASWWGFDEVDATRCLQEAINSGVRRLIVDNVGKTWVVEPIKCVSNQEIHFEPGVEVRAKRGSFKGGGDCLFTIANARNVSLIGYGATLRMWRDDYDRPELYTKAEWRHVVSILSSRNVKVYGLTLAESGGDGIYIGVATKGVTDTNIHIKDVVCDRNYRQGISVISARNLLIENTVMSNTGGTAPMAGIDFEPNGPDEMLVNCVMRNCTTRGNRSWGYVMYIPTLNGSSQPVSVRLENCRSIGDAAGAFGLTTGNTRAAAVKGAVELIGCRFISPRSFGIVINSKPVNGCRLVFRDCVLTNPASRNPTTPPILFDSSQDSREDVGGVLFDNFVLRDPLDRKPMGFVDATGNLKVSGLGGAIVLDRQGQRETVVLTDRQLRQWMPALNLKRIRHYDVSGKAFEPLGPLPGANLAPSNVRVRGKSSFVLYALAGEPVTMTIAFGQLGRYTGTVAPVDVTSPTGKACARAEIPFQGEGEVSFTAPETGLYQVTVDPGTNWARIVRSNRPLSVSAVDGSVHLLSTSGPLYFYVPPRTPEFGVKLFGEGSGEGIKAALYDRDGQLVGEQDNITQAYQFEVARPEPEGRVWRVELSPATIAFHEDHYLDLFGIPPFLAGVPEAVLKPAN